MQYRTFLWALVGGDDHDRYKTPNDFWSIFETKSWSETSHDQMKAPEQYFPAVLFIMLYKVIQTFEPASKDGVQVD